VSGLGAPVHSPPGGAGLQARIAQLVSMREELPVEEVDAEDLLGLGQALRFPGLRARRSAKCG
jgi:hypothetical protein